jgi:phosphoglycolate phosphatase/pyrophosphatase PpaX
LTKLEAVLFDFDGTLADTLPVCIRSLQRIFEEFDGMVYGEKEIVAMFGPPEDDIIRFNLRNREKTEDAVEAFCHYYKEEHPARGVAIDGMNGLLRSLRSRGLKLGIVTGKARRSLDISLAYFGMDGCFDVEITGSDVVRPKPDPEGVAAALAALGCEPQAAVFVGDSDADIRAGLGAGVPTFGAHWSGNVQNASFPVAPAAVFVTLRDFEGYISHLLTLQE